MHAYLLALEIEPVIVNKVYVALPLHCTVVPWFYSEQSPASVLKAITQTVQDQSQIELVSGPDDLFGKGKDVPVNRIANHEEVRQFHTKLYTVLQGLGITDNESQWMKDGYTPHVTRQRSGRFEEGRRFVTTKLYLAEALSPEKLQEKKIIAKVFLDRPAA